jgi:hypothetical protein
MPNAPMCHTCETDRHLELEHLEPGHHQASTIVTVVGVRIPSQPIWVNPVVTYRCRECGRSRVHSVPASWDPQSILPAHPAVAPA